VKRPNGAGSSAPLRFEPELEIPELPARVLVIGESDPSGGAGVQADLKTVHALGAYATTVITALTVQDTCRVHEVMAADPFVVERQLEVVLDDIGADCLKIGMLATRTTVELVSRVCAARARGIPIVLDPVFLSSAGHPLLELEGHTALIQRLLPLAALSTPNAYEAGLITGLDIREEAHMHLAADRLLMMGQSAVLITGGQLPGEVVVDLLRTADGLERRFEAPRRAEVPRGGGGALGAAIAAGLAHGYTLESAVERAHDFVQASMQNAVRLGRGRPSLFSSAREGTGQRA
jgi:hydroxymethylpyrimidine/phosphomethylpyrimidine kinase